jgi:prepilin-type N-terminal cleavage/methylation domain-containing protein
MKKLSNRAGFTLIELMFVLAIVGIFLGLAVPNFQSTIRSNAREEAAFSLVNALALARSEAITRGQQVMVAPNAPTDSPAGTGTFSGGVWSIVLQDLSPAFPGGDPSPVIDIFQVSKVDSVSAVAPGGADLSAPFVFNSDGTLGQSSIVSFCYTNIKTCNQLRISLVGRVQMSKMSQ